MKSDRIAGLDLIRTIAITIVIIFHSTPILQPLTTIPAVGKYFHMLFGLTEPFGILGVELFFVLSGFLIGSILIRMYIKTEIYGFEDIRSFLVRRWFRTIPNYWLMLIVNMLLYSFLGLRTFSIGDGRYFLFVQNLWYRHPDFFAEAWSLAIEEWFYLTLPVSLLVIAFIFKKESKKKKLFIIFVLYSSLFLLLRMIFNTNNPDPLYFDWGIRKIVLFRLDAISYGFLMAYLYAYYKSDLLRHRKILLIISVLGIILLTGAHFLGIHPAFRLYAKYEGFRVFNNVFLLTLIPGFFCLCIPYAATISEIRNRIISVTVSTISKISYSMYLVHFTFIFLPFWQLIKYTRYNCVPVYLLYWAIVIVTSLLLYHYFELPVMNLRKKISKEDPKI